MRNAYKVVKQIVESTDPKQSTIPHQKPWVRHRKSREIEGDHVYVFSDGSSLGSYAAVVVSPKGVTRHGDKAPMTSTRNVGAELNGAILGLSNVESGSSVVLVFDYMGVGAWLTENWKIKDPEVQSKIDALRLVIKTKRLTVHYIHHAGHQRDGSAFTRWNAEADALCTAQLDVVDGVGAIDEIEGVGEIDVIEG